MKEITQKELIKMIKQDYEQDGKRYCFILGAGASANSGIPTGYALVKKWFHELESMLTKEQLKARMEELGIDDISVSSKNYFSMFDLRFYADKKVGQNEIENLIEGKKPNPGYYALNKQLTNKRNNLVITTNFDELVEDALRIANEIKPFSVDHEALATFIDFVKTRPIIMKLHRGMFLNIKNSKEEQEKLETEWVDVLTKAFETYTPIVIGYAGGDHSLMNFLTNDSTKFKSIYWCQHGNNEILPEIKNLIEKKNGCCVRIDGFDEFMTLLAEEFGHKIKQTIEAEDNENEADEPKKKIVEEQKQTDNVPKFDDYIIDDVFDNLKNAYQNKENKNYTDVEHYTKEFIKNDLKYIKLYNRGNQYSDSGKYKRAVFYYNKLISTYGNFENVYFNRGKCYYRLKDYKKAINDFDVTAKNNSENKDLYYVRGQCNYKLNEYLSAINDFSKVISIDENFVEAFYYRGECYRELNKYTKAINDYGTVIELYDENSYSLFNYKEYAFLNRGDCYFDLNKYRKALDDYNKGFLTDRKSMFSSLYNKVMFYKCGNCYFSLKNYKKAIASFDKTIELDPKFLQAYNARGNSYYELHEYEKAIKDFDSAVKLDSNYATAYFNRGYVYADLKEYAKAIKDFSKAISLNSNDKRAYLERAEVYDILGEPDKAAADRAIAEEFED